ncbi:MAG: hypothetical protein AB7O62_06820 [Pirellulales bacterium]
MTDQASPTIRLERISKILSIKHKFIPTDPPEVRFVVTGEVDSTGWTEAQLVRRIYVSPPAEGIWEYDLLAKPPASPSPPTRAIVTVEESWKSLDTAKVKGIRVYGTGDDVQEILLP